MHFIAFHQQGGRPETPKTAAAAVHGHWRVHHPTNGVAGSGYWQTFGPRVCLGHAVHFVVNLLSNLFPFPCLSKRTGRKPCENINFLKNSFLGIPSAFPSLLPDFDLPLKAPQLLIVGAFCDQKSFPRLPCRVHLPAGQAPFFTSNEGKARIYLLVV